MQPIEITREGLAIPDAVLFFAYGAALALKDPHRWHLGASSHSENALGLMADGCPPCKDAN